MTDNLNKYKLNTITESLSIQIIRDRIKLGNELQEIDNDLNDDQILKFNDAIILAPDYQREYRSTSQDESSLVESILLGIPIPPIFLASHKYKEVQVLNVVDGQHRLRAFFRFIEGQFKLKGLKILNDNESKFFSELDIDDKRSFQSGNIPAITFREFPGKEFELEIFSRYNKGTKPLTPQEIRHAVYGSRINDYINVFCKNLLEDGKSKLAKAYGISKDRYQKKSIQESLFVILYILEKGINDNLQKSPIYAEEYMKEKSKNEKDNDFDIVSSFTKTKDLFNLFNDFLKRIIEKSIEYPFSREIYGFSRRKSKFQISIAMIVSAIFNKMNKSGLNNDEILSDKVTDDFIRQIGTLLKDSHLESPDYKASSTNPTELKKIINDFKINKN